ncbi:hypothetical protein AVEN_32755-1 [Araneus ventricosus]|uniref:Uncharacterized protein n=1 Tax=Araneus ventricosus TaxID=182803 RepID=A0A4Y2CUQ6_ARAVE|nr:hypothetical protein AVEN_32755-1 [Araneus ventricosus]
MKKQIACCAWRGIQERRDQIIVVLRNPQIRLVPQNNRPITSRVFAVQISIALGNEFMTTMGTDVKQHDENDLCICATQNNIHESFSHLCD